MLNRHRARWYNGNLPLFLLAAMMSATLLNGCGQDTDYSTAPAKLTVNGEDVNVPYVATINDKKVSLDEYRYYFLSTKYAADAGDAAYWADDTDGSRQRKLKNDALQAMLETYAVENLAQELELSLTKDEKTQIERDVQNQISLLGGAEEYTQALSDNYMTDELYRFLWKTNFYCEKLWNYYFSSEGPYYISNLDSSLTDDQLEEEYQIKFKSIIAEAVDQLDVQLQPEYELITVDSLT